MTLERLLVSVIVGAVNYSFAQNPRQLPPGVLLSLLRADAFAYSGIRS